MSTATFVRPLHAFACDRTMHEVYYKLDNLKVNCTLVQALRLCTGRTTHRGSRGLALLFLDQALEGDEGSASRAGRSLPPGKTRYPFYRRLGGSRAGMDRCGKSRPHRDSIPGPSSP